MKEKIMNYKKYIGKEVRIIWNDSTRYDGWSNAENLSAPDKVLTLGILEKETKKDIYIMSTVILQEGKEKSHTGLNIIAIPVGCIEKIDII